MEAHHSIKLVSLKGIMLEEHQKVKGRAAKSEEQLYPKLPQCFSPSEINSYPEASPAPFPSHAYSCRYALAYQPRTLASSPDLSHFWQSEGVKEGLWAFSYPCFTGHQPSPGGVGSRQGRCSGWRTKASCGARRADARVSSSLRQCCGMSWWGMLMGDRVGEAVAVKHVKHVTDIW